MLLSQYHPCSTRQKETHLLVSLRWDRPLVSLHWDTRLLVSLCWDTCPWSHYAGTLVPWSHYAGILIPWSHYAGTLVPWSHYAGTLIPWSHYAGTFPWSHYAGTLITALPRHLILVYQSAVDTFTALCSVYCMYQPWRILISTAWEAAGRKKVALWSQRQRSTVQSVLFRVLLVPAMADGGNGRARALCFLKKESSEAIYNVLLGSG